MSSGGCDDFVRFWKLDRAVESTCVVSLGVVKPTSRWSAIPSNIVKLVSSKSVRSVSCAFKRIFVYESLKSLIYLIGLIE